MTGARARRAARIASALPIVAELRGHERECNETWWARHDSREEPALWLVTPVSHGNREADALDDSNFASTLDNTSSFEEWASDLGYETDSRKAEKAYRLTCLQAEDLAEFMPELAEWLGDYETMRY